MKVKKGYTYNVKAEELQRYSQLQPAERLRWLSETADFIEKASTPKTRSIRKKFRDGTI